MLTEHEAAAKAGRVRLDLGAIIGPGHSAEKVVTCETCPVNDGCEFAWDLYNTDGDCLAVK